MMNKEVYFICRTCLKIGTNYHNLFKYNEDGKALCDMLIECINTQVEENDGLPCYICGECKSRLYSAWAFKLLALESESKLRNNKKTTKKNEGSNNIKEEINMDYYIQDKMQSQYSDLITLKNNSIRNVGNLEDIAMQENEKSSINGDGEDRNKYLDELQCKDEITVITDNIKVYENDLSEYSTNLQCENTNSINMYCNNYLLEEKTLNLDVKLDNEIVIKNEEQNNSNLYSEDSCINNADKTVSNITNIKDQLKLGRSPSDKLNHKELLIAECKQTEDSAEETNIVKCKNCNQSFHSKYLLNRHRVIHENKRYICQICNAEFHTFNQLKYHKQKHKNKFKLHQCDICKKVFKSRSNLTAHVKQHTRTQESKPVCELCGKIYADINSIRRHYETHNTDKTIPCPTCGKLFTNQKNMALHLVRHNPHNPHVCEHCSKGFKTLGGKKRHILIHTGEKPHPCKICDKRFADRSTLSRHMLTHTAETRFACDKCPYQCRYKQQFDTHLRKHK